MSKLHLVFGGRVSDPQGLDFVDLANLDVVGLYPEVQQIRDEKLKRAVIEIWEELWAMSKLLLSKSGRIRKLSWNLVWTMSSKSSRLLVSSKNSS